MNHIIERANVTCRTCWGFAHSQKKCSTARKLIKMKMVSDVAKSGIHRILAGASIIKVTETSKAWPVMTKTDEFVSQNASAKAFASMEAKTVLSNFRDRIIALNDLVCTACRGWGHISTDGLGKGKKFCIVNELVDQAYADAT